MKKVLIICTILLSTMLVQSQAVLEHVYSDQYTSMPVKLCNSTWIYWTYHYNTPKTWIKIYTENHVLIKTVQLNMPTGYTLYTVSNVSDNLFNSDNKIEILYSIYKYDAGSFDHKGYVINEDEAIIQTFPGMAYANVVNMDWSFKLIGNYPIDSSTSVYSLPGTMVDMPQVEPIFQEVSAFPNPCTSSVTLSYPLTATSITISSLSGIEFYRSPASMGSQAIDTRNLPAGTYVYNVSLASGGTQGGKFTVIR